MSAVVWRRSFPGNAIELHDVRKLVTALLAGCPVLDDAITCLEELASNAVIHTRSCEDVFVVEVRLARNSVRIAVEDAGGPTVPSLLSPGQEEMLEGGRGLAIVAALSAHMGVEGDTEGRVVWAELRWIAAETTPASAVDYLEQLRDRLQIMGFLARVCPADGRAVAYLRVINPEATSLTEIVYAAQEAEQWHFWWGWAEKIATVDDIEAVSRRIAHVLTPVRRSES
ncbi:ATP-binding protein [Streptosporangium sp. 'caverna']|uniref:ATP-binding protein n=1 Tax=Streptosporangium sp. 'caverna' TaxID=2202249 RepID=UPI000D7E1238|nr:ATP-binding protein [Streptosporangium sp. 'caverna']AWS46132.1 hypothetical protein DKM19_37395 [Streptosporangium sp. 'caverna']